MSQRYHWQICKIAYLMAYIEIKACDQFLLWQSWLSTLFHTSQTNKCFFHYEWVKSILNIWDKSLRNYVLPCKLHSLWFFFDVLLKRRFDWRIWFPPVTNTMQTTMALSGLQLPVYFVASARILSNVSVIYWHCFQIHGFTNVKGLHTSTYIFYLVLMDGTFSLRD